MKQYFLYAVMVLFSTTSLFSMPRSVSHRKIKEELDASYVKEMEQSDEASCEKQRKKRAWLNASIDAVFPKTNPCALQPGPLSGCSNGDCS